MIGIIGQSPEMLFDFSNNLSDPLALVLRGR
jgi:hypothetical protein